MKLVVFDVEETAHRVFDQMAQIVRMEPERLAALHACKHVTWGFVDEVRAGLPYVKYMCSGCGFYVYESEPGQV